METINVMIQRLLNEIDDVDSGVPIPDGLVEKGQTYFGYEVSRNYNDSDFNRNDLLEFNLLGRLVRYEDPEENTLEIVHHAVDEVIAKLKVLNFKCSVSNVTIDDSIRKMQINAFVRFSELNDQLIL